MRRSQPAVRTLPSFCRRAAAVFIAGDGGVGGAQGGALWHHYSASPLHSSLSSLRTLVRLLGWQCRGRKRQHLTTRGRGFAWTSATRVCLPSSAFTGALPVPRFCAHCHHRYRPRCPACWRMPPLLPVLRMRARGSERRKATNRCCLADVCGTGCCRLRFMFA